MAIEIITLSPRQTFEDNMRPAELLIQVYRLLESNPSILNRDELLAALRQAVGAPEDEDLLLIYNEVFLGLVRERARVHRSTFRQATLCHLLRQSVVASCTALETYLPALLRANLPVMIQARGRDFVSRGDQILMEFLADLQFSLDDTLRLLGDENAPEFISSKILRLADFKYLSSRKGIHVAGVLLGIAKPWDAIAEHLNRDRKELQRTLYDTVNRRNDIVHRADRPQAEPGGEAQIITFAWTQQAVDVISHVCLALDELVAARVADLKEMLAA